MSVPTCVYVYVPRRDLPNPLIDRERKVLSGLSLSHTCPLTTLGALNFTTVARHISRVYIIRTPQITPAVVYAFFVTRRVLPSLIYQNNTTGQGMFFGAFARIKFTRPSTPQRENFTAKQRQNYPATSLYYYCY